MLVEPIREAGRPGVIGLAGQCDFVKLGTGRWERIARRVGCGRGPTVPALYAVPPRNGLVEGYRQPGHDAEDRVPDRCARLY